MEESLEAEEYTEQLWQMHPGTYTGRDVTTSKNASKTPSMHT